MQFRFDSVFYCVSDLECALRFYKDMPGLRLVSRDANDVFGTDKIPLASYATPGTPELTQALEPLIPKLRCHPHG